MFPELSWKELPELAAQKRLPSTLAEGWEIRTGHPPIEAARIARGSQRFFWLGFLAGWGGVVFVLVYAVFKPRGLPHDLLIGSFILFLSVGIFSAIIRSYKSGVKLSHARKFAWHVTLFYRWSKANCLEDMRSLRAADLRNKADQILRSAAQAVLSWQVENEGVPHELWKAKQDALISDLKMRYDFLFSLGLVEGGYGPYFSSPTTAES
jgi:hypothetical protein